jgi:hypothetical protein
MCHHCHRWRLKSPPIESISLTGMVIISVLMEALTIWFATIARHQPGNSSDQAGLNCLASRSSGNVAARAVAPERARWRGICRAGGDSGPAP